MSLPAGSGRSRLPVTSRLRRAVWELRTEGGGPAREALAIGLGVFIGCSPLYGLHLIICWVAGWCLQLNRLKMYLAANISNPFVAPVLLLAELQTGAWLRRGEPHSLTLEAVRNLDPWSFGADLIVGSLVVGGVLGAATGIATYLLARAGADDPEFRALAGRAADRYVGTSVMAWEFARGKLKGDPLYRTVLMDSALPSGGTLVDVGCGQGLMLALLAEAADSFKTGGWPASWAAPPVFDRLVGIETRRRVAALAGRALGDAATIIVGDARHHVPKGSRVVLLFDVLHMIPREDQERLLTATAAALDPGGVILVREPDAAAGWRFAAVRMGNGLKAFVTGNWRQTFDFRTLEEWKACFEDLGLEVQARGAGDGTPFANVLFALSVRESAPGRAPRFG
jgi:uncharacterized protein (DUF2062 family)